VVTTLTTAIIASVDVASASARAEIFQAELGGTKPDTSAVEEQPWNGWLVRFLAPFLPGLIATASLVTVACQMREIESDYRRSSRESRNLHFPSVFSGIKLHIRMLPGICCFLILSSLILHNTVPSSSSLDWSKLMILHDQMIKNGRIPSWFHPVLLMPVMYILAIGLVTGIASLIQALMFLTRALLPAKDASATPPSLTRSALFIGFAFTLVGIPSAIPGLHFDSFFLLSSVVLFLLRASRRRLNQLSLDEYNYHSGLML
jgi:hypothetical protein